MISPTFNTHLIDIPSSQHWSDRLEKRIHMFSISMNPIQRVITSIWEQMMSSHLDLRCHSAVSPYVSFALETNQSTITARCLFQAAAAATASAPHHRHYRLESPSAASFARHPPWFDDEREETNGTASRTSRNSNQHTKRQRSSAVSTPTSQSSQPYHHHERKRSRQETDHSGSELSNPTSVENVSQPAQQQYRPSSHHHYQPYP